MKFQEWSKIYGPVYTLWNGRRPTLVISDPMVAVELMEKRSNNFSSRPRTVAMGELYFDHASILTTPYNKEWTIRRKLLHHAMTPSALRLYKPVQEAEATRLCNQLLYSPQNWEQLLERFTSSIVFSIAYGHRIDSMQAKVLKERFEQMHFNAQLNVPGAYAVETFPILKYVPQALAPWKREIMEKGKEAADGNIELVDRVRDDIRRSKEKGTPVAESLTKLLLGVREKEHIPLSERDFSFVPASLFGAGSDTTASTLCSAFLAFVTHPSTLQTAQREVDAVVGATRSPTFADASNMPYLNAVVKEVLRWRPVAVLGGTPHANTAADNYKGWHIPAGTTILGNSWAINLNDEYYTHPHTFEPARFLENSLQEKYSSHPNMDFGSSKTHPSKLGHSSFGWGRRICPGAELATNSLTIALAKLIWAFDIRGIEGRKYDIFDYTQGFNSRPRSFECEVRVRGGERKAVLERDMEGAMEVLGKFTPFEE